MDILDSDILQLQFDQPAPKVGDILIAEPLMENGIFGRSTIVLVEHGDHLGSMGFITNMRTDYTLNELVEDIEREEEIPVYMGGPVHTNRLFYIHTIGHLIPQSEEVCKGLYVGGDFNAMIEYVNSGAPIQGKVRFLLGYSGWSKDQLLDDLKNYDWAVSEMHDAQIIITLEGDEAWRAAVNTLDSRYRMWLNCPSSVFFN